MGQAGAGNETHPCGCGGGASLAAEGIPTLEELDSQLAAAQDEAMPMSGGDEGSLELAALEGDLAADELEAAMLESDEVLSLKDLVEFAERHPGLRVTLSY